MRKFILIGLLVALTLTFSFASAESQDNFRFRIFYPVVGEKTGLTKFSEPDFSLRETWSLGDYYFQQISWFSYNPFGDQAWLGLFKQLPWKTGDRVPLRHFRTVNRNESKGYDFGLEAEVRVWWKFFLGLGYWQTRTFTVDILESADEVILKKVNLLYEGKSRWFNSWIPYYEYYLQLAREDSVVNKKEKWNFHNFRIFLNGEIGPHWLKFKLGGGIDFLQINYNTKTEKQVISLGPFLGNKISQGKVETLEQNHKDWSVRPYLMVGLRIPIPGIKKISIEAQGVFLGKAKFNYSQNLTLPIKNQPNNWTVKTGASRVSVGISFSI